MSVHDCPTCSQRSSPSPNVATAPTPLDNTNMEACESTPPQEDPIIVEEHHRCRPRMGVIAAMGHALRRKHHHHHQHEHHGHGGKRHFMKKHFHGLKKFKSHHCGGHFEHHHGGHHKLHRRHHGGHHGGHHGHKRGPHGHHGGPHQLPQDSCEFGHGHGHVGCH